MTRRGLLSFLRLVPLALVLPLLSLACTEDAEEAPSDIGLRFSTVTPSPTPPPVLTPAVDLTPSPTPTPTAVPNVCPQNPDPASPDVLIVEEPEKGDALTSPAHVRGWGAGIAFEDAGVQVTIYDATGQPVAETKAPPLSPEGRIPPDVLEVGEFSAPFAVDVAFTTRIAQPGCVEVFELSAADGSPVHVVQVPVLLQP